jgi:hypothetical protein
MKVSTVKNIVFAIGVLVVIVHSAAAATGSVSGAATLNTVSFTFASDPANVPPGALTIATGQNAAKGVPTCLSVTQSSATVGFRITESDDSAYPVGATLHLFLWDNGTSEPNAPVDSMKVSSANQYPAETCAVEASGGIVLDYGDFTVVERAQEGR